MGSPIATVAAAAQRPTTSEFTASVRLTSVVSASRYASSVSGRATS